MPDREVHHLLYPLGGGIDTQPPQCPFYHQAGLAEHHPYRKQARHPGQLSARSVGTPRFPAQVQPVLGYHHRPSVVLAHPTEVVGQHQPPRG